MSAFEKGQKNGCWQKLNSLISIPTLNIYLKVKLKPLQKLKTGCVNTMLSIYNDPQGRASPTKVLENSLGTWIKDSRSSQTPCLSWASESTQSPQGRTCDDWLYRIGAWPSSQGGHRRTLHSSSPIKYSRHTAHPRHMMGYTCCIVGPTCTPVQESSAHCRGWHMALTQEWCLCFGYDGGMFDHIMEEMLTTLEREVSCRPSEQFRWSTAFSILIPEEINAMK